MLEKEKRTEAKLALTPADIGLVAEHPFDVAPRLLKAQGFVIVAQAIPDVVGMPRYLGRPEDFIACFVASVAIPEAWLEQAERFNLKDRNAKAYRYFYRIEPLRLKD